MDLTDGPRQRQEGEEPDFSCCCSRSCGRVFVTDPSEIQCRYGNLSQLEQIRVEPSPNLSEINFDRSRGFADHRRQQRKSVRCWRQSARLDKNDRPETTSKKDERYLFLLLPRCFLGKNWPIKSIRRKINYQRGEKKD